MNLIFLMRISLGLLLFIAGILKAHDGTIATITSIAGYRILPAFIVGPLGIVLPWIEMLLGSYLILGLFTTIISLIISGQFLIFSIAVASLVIRNIPVDCGCFGSSVPTPPSWGHVAADVALMFLALLIAFVGPGRFALDTKLSPKKIKEIKNN